MIERQRFQKLGFFIKINKLELYQMGFRGFEIGEKEVVENKNGCFDSYGFKIRNKGFKKEEGVQKIVVKVLKIGRKR